MHNFNYTGNIISGGQIRREKTNMAESDPTAVDPSVRVERLIQTIAYSGKEMFYECFGQTDRKTKTSVLPLLERVDDFEICGALLLMFLRGKEEPLQEIADKLQTYANEIQEDLTDLKAKISVNKDFLKQIRADYESFCNTFDEITQLFIRADNRISSGIYIFFLSFLLLLLEYRYQEIESCEWAFYIGPPGDTHIWK